MIELSVKPSYEYLLIKPTPFHNMPHLKGLSELNLQQILITCDKKTYEAQTHTTVLSVKLPCSSSNWQSQQDVLIIVNAITMFLSDCIGLFS